MNEPASQIKTAKPMTTANGMMLSGEVFSMKRVGGRGLKAYRAPGPCYMEVRGSSFDQ